MNVSLLKHRIQEDMKAAMRSREVLRLSTIRMLLAAIKQKEIDEQVVLDDAAIVAVINKMIKQRQEAQTQYRIASRLDLAEKEGAEIDILRAYLPEALSEAEVMKYIRSAIETTGAQSVRDMGKVMALVKEPLAGRVDMAQVSQWIKSLLS